MRLTRLDITGFKSFGERTVLTIQPGITAVVGPNGCGKSNIADAILWCLGEQSAKTLRGDRMDDVLFNGSARRAATGLAEVSLTLGGIRRDELGAVGEYSEVTITRRLYRSGDSEYLINRVPCRLKDIRDLLIETGAGVKGHTVLEQGKVDSIVNASPLERRTLVEETAGITKYKLRKTEALRKLDSTEQNLLRVRDIIGEVKRQLASLDRQAKKAERYRATYEQLKTIELAAAVVRHREWDRQAVEFSAAVDRERTEEARLMTDLAAIDAKLEGQKADLADFDRRYHDAQAALAEAETRAQAARHRLDFLAAQIEEWGGQRTALLSELERLERNLVERREEHQRCASDSASVDAALEEQAVVLASREEVVRALEQRMAQAAADIEQTRHQVFQALSGLTAATNVLTTLATRRDELGKRRTRYCDEITATQSEILQKQTTHHELEAAHQLYARSLAVQDAERTALRDASVGRQAALQEGEAVLTARRDELTRLRATLDSLTALQRDLVGYDEGVRHVLHGGDGGDVVPGLLGVVADVLDIPPQYERAIEAALADRLQGVVAEGHDRITTALAVLDAHQAGRATFVPRAPRFDPASPRPTLPSAPGFHGPAHRLVGCRPGFEALRDGLLERVVIVDDRVSAQRYWEEDLQGLTWVSVSGDVWSPSGVVSGGAGPRAGLGLLERKRTIKTLELDLAGAERALTPIEASVAGLREALETDHRALESLDEELRSGELQLVHDQKAAEAVAQDVLQLERRLALLTSEEETAGHELDTMAATVAENESALIRHEAAKVQEERRLLAQYETAAQLKNALAESAAAVTDVRMELAALREKREHLVAALRTLATGIEDIAGQITTKQTARDHLETRTTTAAQERERVSDDLKEIAAGIERLRRAVAELGESRSTHAHGIRELEDVARVARREVDGLQPRLQTLTVSLAETRLRVTQLTGEILDRYQVDLTAAAEPLPPLPCEPDQIDAEVARLRDALAQFGGANLSAIDEYRELEERHRFLTTQESDLTLSVDNLRAAITKINATTRELFLEAFHALNAKFGEVYASFFEGGQAELRLADDGNPLDCGIEIVAQPPGKKLRHISLLSGGEKALTAIALLFASFLIHPSPFCVMDEIDAPLDEENVRRFTRMLRPMTAHSQFLVVTHNRRTMEQADVLYGVTMEEPGVSKLVSVRLHADHADTGVEVETATAEMSF